VARSSTSDALVLRSAGSSAEVVELALDATPAAEDASGETFLMERAAVLNAIADAFEATLDMLAAAETWEYGNRCERAGGRAPICQLDEVDEAIEQIESGGVDALLVFDFR